MGVSWTFVNFQSLKSSLGPVELRIELKKFYPMGDTLKNTQKKLQKDRLGSFGY